MKDSQIARYPDWKKRQLPITSCTWPETCRDLGSGYYPNMGKKNDAMDKDDAARIQSASDRNPDSDSATSGFAERAQSAADRHEDEGNDD